jgi:hypothetical protein
MTAWPETTFSLLLFVRAFLAERRVPLENAVVAPPAVR